MFLHRVWWLTKTLKQIYANYSHYTIQPRSNTSDRVVASPGVTGFPTPLYNKETINTQSRVEQWQTAWRKKTDWKKLTLVGSLAPIPGPSHNAKTKTSLKWPVTLDTSTVLFPFAQANTYREWLPAKGLWEVKLKAKPVMKGPDTACVFSQLDPRSPIPARILP